MHSSILNYWNCVRFECTDVSVSSATAGETLVSRNRIIIQWRAQLSCLIHNLEVKTAYKKNITVHVCSTVLFFYGKCNDNKPISFIGAKRSRHAAENCFSQSCGTFKQRDISETNVIFSDMTYGTKFVSFLTNYSKSALNLHSQAKL